MQLLDLTLDTPEENLALDEALLEAAEQRADETSEVLRLWEPRQLAVVVGSSSRLADEVQLDACTHGGVPVLRRASGGAAIVIGPGCLMYAVVLKYETRPELRSIHRAHRFVLETISQSLQSSLEPVQASPAGISDLAIGGRKFSGNSMRCKRKHLLYHGSLLYRFPLERIGELLKLPARQPEYRQGRSHADFLINLPLDALTLRGALVAAFEANVPLLDWPGALVARLVTEKYSRPD